MVENRDLLEDRRIADAISVTSQSQPFPNYQQPVAWFVGLFCIFDHDHVKWRAKVFSLHYKAYFGKKFTFYDIKQVD